MFEGGADAAAPSCFKPPNDPTPVPFAGSFLSVSNEAGFCLMGLFVPSIPVVHSGAFALAFELALLSPVKFANGLGFAGAFVEAVPAKDPNAAKGFKPLGASDEGKDVLYHSVNDIMLP